MTSEEAIKYLREAAEWITEMADHDFEEDKHGKWCEAIDISIDTLESLRICCTFLRGARSDRP